MSSSHVLMEPGVTCFCKGDKEKPCIVCEHKILVCAMCGRRETELQKHPLCDKAELGEEVKE